MLRCFKANSNKRIIYDVGVPAMPSTPSLFSNNEAADAHFSWRQINTLRIDQKNGSLGHLTPLELICIKVRNSEIY